jgi:hypothetical protein
VYFIYYNNDLLYVGSTFDIKKRIRQHRYLFNQEKDRELYNYLRKNSIQFEKLLFKHIKYDYLPDEESLKKIETLYIRALNPITNIYMPRRTIEEWRYDNKEKFTCKACDKAFQRQSCLNRHIKGFHDNERPFHCKTCDKWFQTQSYLNRHIKTIHNNERAFHCKECNKAFQSQSNLNTHIKGVHDNERPFHCKTCDKWFQRQTHLNTHIKTQKHQETIT